MTTCWQQSIASAAITCLLLTVGQVRANGMDPTVVAGQASFSAQGNSLEITNSPGTVINWQGFSIGAGESTQFIQQNAASSVLNRVIGPDPSMLLGTLTSNGRVFLINPSGIVVGEGARIDVAGLVASTLNLSNEDFAAGRLNFVSDPFAGTVENRGSIVTPSGGSVYLAGPNVSNSGLIDSPQGEVILAAGQSARIFDSSAPGVRVEVTGSDNLAVNLGEILAKSGEIGIYAAAFRNAGIINADQVVRDASGKIVLRATQDITLEAGSQISATGERAGTIVIHAETGTSLVSGRIDASSTGAGQTGGSVKVLGDQVGLFDGHIDASGDAGGGTVLVGGDFQGKNPDVQNATATYMSADARVTADAVIDGSGGTVVLWADGSTRAYGSISARGGAHGGNGGLIETSGGWLDVAGIDVDASGPKGTAGIWLLDPNNITIQSGGANTNVTASPNFTSTDDDAIVTTASIETALNAGTSVIVATGTGGANTQEGDITVADTLTWTHVNGPTLTLDAHRDVVVNAAVTATTGSFLAKAGGDVNLNEAVTVTTGNITAIADGDVNVNAAMTVTTGDIVLHGDNDGTGPGAVVGGTVNVTCGSNCLTITTGTLRIRFNPESYATTDAEITAYDANLTGGGILDAKAWVFGLGDDRLYDGTTVATVSGLEPDVLGAAPAATLGTVTNANFDTKHVGTDKLITYDSDFSDSVHELFAPFGTPVGTYTTRADILVRPLAVDAVTDTRVYDATTNSSGIPTVTGLQTGDSLNGALTQSFLSKDVLGAGNSTLVADGTYSVSDGNSGNNYAITVNTAPGTITPLAVTLTAPNVTKIYDGGLLYTTQAADLTALAAPLLGDDTVTAATIDYLNRNAGDGDKAVDLNAATISDGNSGNNYAVTLAGNSTSTITARPLTVTAATDTKTYDATTSSSGVPTHEALQAGDTTTTFTQTFDNKNVGTGKTLTAAGVVNDGNSGNNYAVTFVDDTTGVIDPLAITGDITADDKVYDATATASILTRTLTGVLASDDVTYVGGTALFDDKNVGTDKTVTGTSLSLAGTDAGNYTVNTTALTTADITPLTITGGITAGNKIYDATDVATILTRTLTGVLGSDDVSYVGGTATFSDRHADTNKTVTGIDLALAGTDAGNYSVNSTTATTANITPAPLGIAANSTSKIYGETVSFTGAEFSSTGLKNGETVGSVSLTSAGAAATAGVAGSPYDITPSAATGGTFNAGNYSITYVDGALGVIPAPLGIAASSTSKTFGETVNFTGTEFSSTGLKNGETIGSVSLASLGAAADAGVEDSPYDITASAATGGTFDAGNYSISYVDGSLGVIPAGLLGIAANAAAKTYDGLAFSGGNGVNYTGFQGDDTSSDLDGTLVYGGSSQGAVDVGEYTIIPSGQSSPNYTITYVNSKLSVIPAPLGIAANSATRLYGEANPAFSATYTGFQNGETPAALTGTLTFATPAIPASNVGSYAIVPSGQSSTNYTINYVNGALGVIPVPLIVTADAQSKVYGASDPALTFGATGLVNNPALGVVDTVGNVFSGALTRAGGETVLGGPYAITQGSLAANSNYTLSSFTGNTLSITPRDITGDITAAAKVYDATDVVTILTRTLTGVLGSDDVTYVGGTALFDDKNVGTDKTVTGTSLSLAGADAGNYTVNSTALTTADITPLAIVGDITAGDRIYDATETATILTRTLTGVLASDDVTYVGGTALFDDKNAGIDKTVTGTSLSLAGTDAGNYTVNTAALTTADITPLAISGAITAGDKIYDATGTADILTRTLTGVLGSDDVTYVGGTALFDDKNAGTDKTVTGIDLALGGADAGNYSVNSTALTTADIMPAPLEVVAQPKSKIFGTNDPPLTFSVTGLISNPELGIDETEDLVLSGALTRAPGESVLGGPYAITQGTLTSNDNYAIDFAGSLLVIVGAAEEPVLGFNAVQFLFAEVTNNVSYYRPGNFWHISLNPNNADPGFDVMRGTEELRSRVNQCDSVSGAGYCETWSFPQQTGEAGDLE